MAKQQCPDCKGQGRVIKYSKTIVCGECNGKGHILVQASPPVVQKTQQILCVNCRQYPAVWFGDNRNQAYCNDCGNLPVWAHCAQEGCDQQFQLALRSSHIPHTCAICYENLRRGYVGFACPGFLDQHCGKLVWGAKGQYSHCYECSRKMSSNIHAPVQRKHAHGLTCEYCGKKFPYDQGKGSVPKGYASKICFDCQSQLVRKEPEYGCESVYYDKNFLFYYGRCFEPTLENYPANMISAYYKRLEWYQKSFFWITFPSNDRKRYMVEFEPVWALFLNFPGVKVVVPRDIPQLERIVQSLAEDIAMEQHQPFLNKSNPYG